MAGILDQILAHKRREIADQKAITSLARLQAQLRDLPPVRNFAGALSAATPMALIAEVKRQSPSKGVIRTDFDPAGIACAYSNGGAAALSVLTDQRFFGGNLEYLQQIRQAVNLPLLRKDFIIDPYQVFQSRVAGADAILLIVAALDSALLQELLELAKTLEMTALVEVHSAAELQVALEAGAGVIGINNRDLATFHTSLAVTTQLAPLVPPGRLLVSESGINTHSDLLQLAQYGVHAVLVGESLMRQADVCAAVRLLLGRTGAAHVG